MKVESTRIKSATIGLVIVLSGLLLAPSEAEAEDGLFVQLDVASSFLGAWAIGSLPPQTVSYDLSGGYRFDSSFGVGLSAEHIILLRKDFGGEGDFPPSLLNVGVLADYTFFEDRLQTGIILGTSTLLVDTPATNGAFSTGFFAEVQPVGVRFPLGDRWTIELEPISFIVAAPVLSAIPLVHLAYRTSLGLEVGF